MSDTDRLSDEGSADELLARADAIHDDDPPLALALLRRIDAARLAPALRPRLSFLVNHVIGEKFDLWQEALATQCTIVAAAAPIMTSTLWRQAAIAAQIADDATRARDWIRALATSGRASLTTAQALVNLGAIGFSTPTLDAETAGRSTLRALQPLAALHALPGTGLDSAFGIVTNNLASDLLERRLGDLGQPDLRTALDLTAEHAQHFWRRAGQWLELERASYLRAMTANALGEGACAAAHARAGLDLIDAHDGAHTQDVDRAFLQLELAQGLRLAGRDAAAASDRAITLAAAFGDAALDKWFADRVRRNEALAAHYGRG